MKTVRLSPLEIMKMMGKFFCILFFPFKINGNIQNYFRYDSKHHNLGTKQEDQENEEESEGEIDEAEEISKKPEIQMNARRWRWEVLDD